MLRRRWEGRGKDGEAVGSSAVAAAAPCALHLELPWCFGRQVRSGAGAKRKLDALPREHSGMSDAAGVCAVLLSVFAAGDPRPAGQAAGGRGERNIFFAASRLTAPLPHHLHNSQSATKIWGHGIGADCERCRLITAGADEGSPPWRALASAACSCCLPWHVRSALHHQGPCLRHKWPAPVPRKGVMRERCARLHLGQDVAAGRVATARCFLSLPRPTLGRVRFCGLVQNLFLCRPTRCRSTWRSPAPGRSGFSGGRTPQGEHRAGIARPPSVRRKTEPAAVTGL